MKIGGIRNNLFVHFHGKCAYFINSPYRVDLARHPKGFSAGPILFLAPLSLILWTLPVTTMAQTVATDATGSAASGGSMLQVILGLGLVLAVMAGSAWLLRRFGGLQRRPGGGIKVIGGSAVGQRERVVLVEVADTWLVIGVAPGHVTALHSMPKGEITGIADPVGGASTDHHFSVWFRQVTAKRDGEQHGK